MILIHFQDKLFNITVIQVYASTTNAEEAEDDWFYDLIRHSRTDTKYVLFIIGDWNVKVGSQEIPEVIGKFGLGVQIEAGQRLTEFCQENTLVIENIVFQEHKKLLYTWTSLDGQKKKKRLIIFFVAEDGEALYSQQKQDWKLWLRS